MSRQSSKRRPTRKRSAQSVPAKGNAVQIAALAIIIGCACTVVCGYAVAAALRYAGHSDLSAITGRDSSHAKNVETVYPSPITPESGTESMAASSEAPARRSKAR